jgi:sulfite reductase alpha subunit-like flavoprotein
MVVFVGRIVDEKMAKRIGNSARAKLLEHFPGRGVEQNEHHKVVQTTPILPETLISEKQSSVVNESMYRYPRGLSVYETLSFCVDLGAVPSPQFVRQISNKKIQDFKQEVALLEERTWIWPRNLEQNWHWKICYTTLPPLLPRYCSIASSPKANNDTFLLCYRPVRYMTTRGVLREGIQRID